MRGGTDLQTYVDILVPSNAKLTLIKVFCSNIRLLIFISCRAKALSTWLAPTVSTSLPALMGRQTMKMRMTRWRLVKSLLLLVVSQKDIFRWKSCWQHCIHNLHFLKLRWRGKEMICQQAPSRFEMENAYGREQFLLENIWFVPYQFCQKFNLELNKIICRLSRAPWRRRTLRSARLLRTRRWWRRRPRPVLPSRKISLSPADVMSMLLPYPILAIP